MTRLPLLASVVLALAGCATATQTVQPWPVSTARPQPFPAATAANGSLFPLAALNVGGGSSFRPLFEDRRARAVGDTLTVLIEESTAAAKTGNMKSERKTELAQSASLGGRSSFIPALGMGVNGEQKFEGKGDASANNSFSGTISVTVLDVLANGNLVVAGEKQVAIGDGEEHIRFSGVINPTLMVGNSIRSVQVADARLEYRSRGTIDDTTRPGWLTRALLNINPF